MFHPGRVQELTTFLGEVRSGKRVVFRTGRGISWCPFGKMGGFPDGVAGPALQQPGGLKYLAD